VINQVVVTDPIRALPRPVDVRPRARRGQVERSAITTEITDAVDHEPVQIIARDGWGKTSVVVQLAHDPSIERYTDGVAVISGWGLPVEDIEQAIFDAFYESTLPDTVHKVTPGQLRTSLGDIEAAIIVDDLDLPRQHVERLIDASGSSAFISSASTQTMWSDGLVLDIKGLDDSDALSLFQQRLGREISGTELETVAAFIAHIRGYPMAIVAAASAVRRGVVLAEMLPRLLSASDPIVAVHEEIAATFSLAETRLLSVLGAVQGDPLPPEAVGIVAGVDDADALLEGLKRDGIIEAASPRYRLARSSSALIDIHVNGPSTARGLTTWCDTEADQGLITAAAPAIASAIRLATHENDYEAAIALGRSADQAISLSGRWGVWGQVLEATRKAAVSAADPFAQGWALHQLGTRALAEQRNDEALSMLTMAADIRRQIGDQAGLEVTEHNLSLLNPPPAVVPPQPPRAASPSSGGIPWWAWTMIVVGLLAIAGIVGLIVTDQDPDITVVTTTAPGNGELVPTPGTIEILGVPSGGSISSELELMNLGPGSVEIRDISIDGHESITVSSECDALGPNESCLVTVLFSPSEPGEVQAALFVAHSGVNGSLNIPVLGFAIDPPEAFVSVDPVNLVFGVVAVGEAASGSIEITNSGEVDAIVDSITINSDLFVRDNSREENDRCASLSPGDSCSLDIRFIASEPGVFGGRLLVNHSGQNPSLEIPLSGIVSELANLVISIVDPGSAEVIVAKKFDVDTPSGTSTFWRAPVTVKIENLGQTTVTDRFTFRFERSTGDDVILWDPVPAPGTHTGEIEFNGSIAPGETVEVATEIGLSTLGSRELLRANVDSCLAEGSPVIPPCRIVESNEGDNLSDPFPIMALAEIE